MSGLSLLLVTCRNVKETQDAHFLHYGRLLGQLLYMLVYPLPARADDVSGLSWQLSALFVFKVMTACHFVVSLLMLCLHLRLLLWRFLCKFIDMDCFYKDTVSRKGNQGAY